MDRHYTPSELIINGDGTAFHLHLRPEQLARKIILVGDPGRVAQVAAHFSATECEVSNREFHTITGTAHGKRITVMSTGIGCGNIDIAVNELDALANINLATREDLPTHTTLEIVRIGTCGGLQEYTGLGTWITSVKSIGLDGLLHFYARGREVCDTELERAFTAHMGWQATPRKVYAATEDPELTGRIAGDDTVRGITVSAGGFYGAQGRWLRAQPADAEQNSKIEAFGHHGLRVANYEMESSALAGLAAILGHKAACVCLVVANRRQQEAFTNYKPAMDGLIETVINRI